VYSSAGGERPVLTVPADGICQAGHGRAVQVDPVFTALGISA